MNEQEFSNALQTCIRCGVCKVDCPTYTSSVTEGETARGRLNLLNAFFKGDIQPSNKLYEKIFSCILCGKCATLCPLEIDILDIFFYSRNILSKYDRRRSFLRFLTRIVFNNTNFSFKISKPLQPLINKILVMKGLIPEDIEFRGNPFKQTGISSPQEKIGRIAVFSGCSVKHIYQELTLSLSRVLNALHYEVIFPNAEICCGAPFMELGMEGKAIKFAEKNFKLFSGLNVDAIISPCPTCVVMLKRNFQALIGKSLQNVYDVSTFIMEKTRTTNKRLKSRLVYHAPCHLINILGVEKAPKDLISLTGANLLETNSHTCCGFGGLFSYSFKEMSNDILKNTCNKLLKTEPDAIVTACPNCIFQLSKSLKKVPIYHIIEVIEKVI